jgi:CubicO group peptidase (beta-lactamase class C family)
VPGAVICVTRRGDVAWHEAYGVAERTPRQRSMRRDTLFDIASLTKVVATTSLVLFAHHEGLCCLDDCLQRFYPNLVDTAMGAVSIRQLLTHSSGLAAWQPLYQMLLPAGPTRCDPSEARRRRQRAAELILQSAMVYPAGSRVLYSDLGFIVLTDILESQYRQSLDALFLRHVARPLGLHRAAYRPLGGMSALSPCSAAYAATEVCAWRQGLLSGEVHDENAWAMGGVAGHAGLFATAEDLCRFAWAFWETSVGRRDWLPAALARQSMQRQTQPSGSTRALGWDTPTAGKSSAGDLFSSRSIGHLGFTGCSLWFDPERQIAVALCTNRVHPTRDAVGIATLRPAVHNLVMRALGVVAP